MRALCTLGTPHAHNEASCVTGGALARVNELWPGAFFSEGEGGEGAGSSERIRYVAVAGRAVVGDAFAARGTAARAAAAAYAQVAGGDGHGVAGDGVVPLSAATLPGAENVVLDGVFHAPRRSPPSSPRWFGEEVVVDSWLYALVKALEE